MTMYTLDCSSGRLPGWAHGVGTLSREQIRKFGDQIDNIEDPISAADEVQCITVADLLDRAATATPTLSWSTPRDSTTSSCRSSTLPGFRPSS